jgi:pimeloyl-ACP methyl ester carboxylesterase
MQAPTTRAFTPARIVALGLIVLAALGLAYLRFATGATPVSVPKGAHAGDLQLKACSYATEAGSYAADCGTLVVPENRADPHSRLIALPVTRIRARSAHPAEAVFRLEGGPGRTNMHFAKASEIAGHHDVVLVGYRGVDGSSVLNCPEVSSALKHSTDFLAPKATRAYTDAFRSCARRLRGSGVDLAGYTIPQRVDDLDAARVALGYDRIDLVSESAGTRTAMIYAWRHPKSIRRSVMIGANPPGNFVWDAKTTDEQIARYAAACSHDTTCHARTDDLAASMRKTAAAIPDHWLFLPIKRGNVRITSFYGLADSTSEAAPIMAPMTIDSWNAAAKGDASGFWFMSLAADLVFPDVFVWGDMGTASRADARAASDYFSSARHRGSILGDPGTAFAWGGGRLTDAWPAAPDENEYGTVRTSNVETLVIGGALDIATPPQIATTQLLPHLPNGHQVILDGFGHTTDFWTYQPEARIRLMNTFLAQGKVDDSLYRPAHVDFTPGVTQTTLAKSIAGGMVGLALVALLSLLWMARRVHWQGRLGRKTRAVLRSVFALVLGLGGWFLGALTVITTMPGIPLDDELLVVLSIGVPVALGIYWSWVHRDWSAHSKGVGIAAATGGAVIGAWLGFHSMAGLPALGTAIVGAAAGANLTVVLLDIAWDRRAHDRVAAPEARATLQARPSAG